MVISACGTTAAVRVARTCGLLARVQETYARVVMLFAHVGELGHAGGAAVIGVMILHHVNPPNILAKKHPVAATASAGQEQHSPARQPHRPHEETAQNGREVV